MASKKEFLGKITKTNHEFIYLGLDPGTSVMGWAILKVSGKKMHVPQYGVIHLKKYASHELRLKKIFERLITIIDEYHPDEIAFEAPFYGKNIQSTLKLGRAQGVAMAAALSREIPISEYAPKKVKQSVTGNGNASKEQVSNMVMSLLGIAKAPKLLDASDALAVAITHYFQQKVPGAKKTSWKSFIADNPRRVKI